MCKMITCKFTLEHEKAAFADVVDGRSVCPPIAQRGVVFQTVPQSLECTFKPQCTVLLTLNNELNVSYGWSDLTMMFLHQF